MRELFNLVVDLDERFASPRLESAEGLRYDMPSALEERALAWIDATFGGWWSSEAYAGANVLASRDAAPVGFASYDAQGLDFAWLRGAARERGVGIFGPIGVAEAERGRGVGTRLLRAALAGLRERGYERALIPAVGDGLVRYYAGAVGARVVESFGVEARARARTLVMASGGGTNLQAVLDGSRDGSLAVDVCALVVNDPRAHAIERARRAGVASIHELPWRRGEEPRAQYDARLLETVRTEAPELVLLLGWMHLLAEPFVHAFPNLINIHPAFLPLDPKRDDVGMPDGTRIPAFRGAHAVRDALAAGSRWTGATAHVVTPQTDRGPVLARRPVRIEAHDDAARTLERLHPVEHDVVASAVRRRLYER